jgi:hypothetical protein
LELIELKAGVPQWSLLSPILFILYIASLYEALERRGNLMIAGFVDDTNLLVARSDPLVNCRRLESAYRVCERWARTRGMDFAPQKSELMHFSRTHAAITQGVLLASKANLSAQQSRLDS